jgi:hypothetical protein
MDPLLKQGGLYVLTCSGEAFVLGTPGIDISFLYQDSCTLPQQGATKVV